MNANDNIKKFEDKWIEKDENNLLWVVGEDGLMCEAFTKTVNESTDDMKQKGYTLIPLRFEGEDIFVTLE